MRFYSLFLIVGLFACKSKETEIRYELEAVKNILATERKAHLTKDVSLLLSNGKDTVVGISRGIVKAATAEESRKRFTDYFNSVEFVKWDDTAEPIFYFSVDSTMAVVIVQKQVIVRMLPGTQNDTTDFGWTAIYRKLDGRWKMIAITSTNK